MSRQERMASTKAAALDSILGDITTLQADSKKKDSLLLSKKEQTPNTSGNNKEKIQSQRSNFGVQKGNSTKTKQQQATLLAQSSSLPAIEPAKANTASFVDMNVGGRERRGSSLGSKREIMEVVEGRKNVKLEPVDNPRESKRDRKLRKTMEVGSVDFDVGFSLDDMKESNVKREERRTLAKEKRDGAVEAQRVAVLLSISAKDDKVASMKARRALVPLQQHWMQLVVLAVRTQQWATRSEGALDVWHAMKLKHDAARVIQRKYKKYIRQIRLLQTIMTRQKLHSVEWRCKLWVKCVRRRLASRQLRVFFNDFAVQQVAYIIFTFRYRVVRVQRMMRSFLLCKKARRQVLEKMWGRLERRVPEDDSAFKTRKGSVIPALGDKLQMASRRFDIIERQLKAKKIEFAPFKEANADEHEGGFVESTNKGVELSTMKFLVRVHIEEQRMLYIQYAAKKLAEKSDAPVVTEDHAKALLRGDLLHVDSDTSRVWPHFMLFKGGKKRFLEVIEEAIKDKETVAERIESQKRYEWELLTANKYELEDEDDGEGSENGGEAEEEESDEDDALTPAEEAAENAELAEKYSTTSQEVQEFREMFQLVDLDHGGSIDGEELGKLLSLLGMEKSEEEIQEMVDKIDTTGEREVFFPDFVRALKSDRPSPKYTEAMVMKSFKFFADKEVEGAYSGATIRKKKQGVSFEYVKPPVPGVISKKQIAFGMSMYGDDKWSEERTENSLHDAGLSTQELDFVTYVNIMFQLATS